VCIAEPNRSSHGHVPHDDDLGDRGDSLAEKTDAVKKSADRGRDAAAAAAVGGDDRVEARTIDGSSTRFPFVSPDQ
jgi:hypothetical protein